MILPWKRFWVPLGGEISCGIYGNGFFDSPSENWAPRNEESARTLEDLLHEQCLFLFGEPGLGKSIALEQAFPGVDHAGGGDDTTIWIRFRDIPDAATFIRRVFDSPRWRIWISNDQKLTLVLDGLDEGVIKIKDFLAFLTSELRTAPVSRLNLVVACRTADWPTSSGSKLQNLLGSSRLNCSWELCPLRRMDVEAAAVSFDVNPNHFLEQVVERNVATLAARPTTLFFLLRQFVDGGELKGTYRDIYEQGIFDLCREPDPERSEGNIVGQKSLRLLPGDIREAAGELAASLILTGHSAISTGDKEHAASNRDLHLESLVNSCSRIEQTYRESMPAALGTALFSSRGENRLGFAHQTFAECLAAGHVAHLPLVQLRKLFCNVDGGEEHVVPQLAETAGWLVGLNQDFLWHVLRTDPEVLLRSDIARIQSEWKAEVVEAILEKAKRHELFDDIGLLRFLSGLNHDHLASQLWAYIKDNSLNIVVRRLALEIAEACRVTQLETELLNLLEQRDIEQQLREQTVQVLEKTLPDSSVFKLFPFAMGEGGSDPNDQIKGYALRKLVPRHWAVATSLQYLTPPKNDHFFGAYDRFLRDQAPDCLTLEDVPALLNFLVDVHQCFDSLSPFCALANKGTCMALRSLENPTTRDALINLWLAKRRKYEHPQEQACEELAALWSDRILRERFAFSLLQDSRTTKDDLWQLLFDSFALLSEEDLPWLLEQLPEVDKSRISIWTEAVAVLAQPQNTAKCWDLFLRRIEEMPEMRAQFAWLRAWDLDEPEARLTKAKYIRRKRSERRLNRRRNIPSTQDLISRDLADIASGESWAWINLCQSLRSADGNTGIFNPSYDILAGSVWKEANESLRTLICNAAKQFLLLYDDGYAKYQSRTNYSDPGYMAVWLLKDSIAQDDELSGAISKKWIHAIVGRANNADEQYQELVSIAYALNADATISALLYEVEDDYIRHDYIFAWRGFRSCWNRQFSSILLQFSLSHCTSRKTLISSLTFLAKVDAPAFENWMLAVLSRLKKFGDDVRTTIFAVAHALVPQVTWGLVWPILSLERGLAAEVFLIAASELEFEIRHRRLSLTTEHLGELAELLFDIFPPEPEVERLGGVVTSRQAVADYRRSVLDALTASTETSAGDALLRLANKYPDQKLAFMWRYRDHLAIRRRTLWQPPSISELAEVMARSEARLVSSEQDLFEVVLESLHKFETYYTKTELPAFERLWRWEKQGNRRTNFQPKDEEDLSDEIARWFRDDLSTRGIIVGREVQIEQRMRTDVLVKAIALDGFKNVISPSLTVVVEVKGCWNRNVTTDVENQLTMKYLLPHGWPFGIYVVGWYICDVWQNPRNHLNSESHDSAVLEVARLGEEMSSRHSGLIIKGVLLDCRYRGA